MTNYKTHDGWDLENIYPLYNIVKSYNNMNNLIYELQNCRRTMSLVEMRNELKNEIELMQESLEEIYDDDQVVEEDENY